MTDRRLPSVLFVCVENSCRSQMAEGFARVLGAGRIVAWSAGSRPAGRVDPRAVAFMRERGIEIAAQGSKSLVELPRDVVWDCVVTMGCGDACPDVSAKERLDWDLPDPRALPDEDFRRVRDRIATLVAELVARLQAGR